MISLYIIIYIYIMHYIITICNSHPLCRLFFSPVLDDIAVHHMVGKSTYIYPMGQFLIYYIVLPIKHTIFHIPIFWISIVLVFFYPYNYNSINIILILHSFKGHP